MGLRRGLIAIGVLALGGSACGASPHDHVRAIAPVVAPARSDASAVTPQTSTTAVASADEVGVKADVAPTGGVVGSGATRAAREKSGPRSPSPAMSPWDRFDGEVTGPTHVVARVTGPNIGVAAHPDEAWSTMLSNTTSSGAPRVFLVVQAEGDWLQVLLPLRPNSSLGWVRRADVEVTSVPYRVVVDRGAHRLQVFDGDTLIVDEPVAVGKASTPTPRGQFFAVELLQPSNPGGAYGPYAFTLSAYSDVYQTFGSGDGAVGMHGTNEPGSIGRDASHGCLRLSNDAVRYLATFLPLGTPVFIH